MALLGHQYRGWHFPDREHYLLESLPFRCVEPGLDRDCRLHTWA